MKVIYTLEERDIRAFFGGWNNESWVFESDWFENGFESFEDLCIAFEDWLYEQQTKRDMRTWKVTIKEKLMDRPIETTYTGDVDYEFVKRWFGCDQPDVEWYKIEEE